MSQQKRRPHPAAPAPRAHPAGRAGRDHRLPEQSLAEILELAASRAAQRPMTAPPVPAPLRRTTRPAGAPAPAIEAPALARIAGSRSPGSATLEFVTNPFHSLDDLEPQSLAVTYWFTSPEGDVPHQVDVRFTGHRLDVTGVRAPADDFVAATTASELSSGPIALTRRIDGVAPGRWSVTAEAFATPRGAGRDATVRLPSAEGVGRSVYALIAGSRAPGVLLGAWPAMVGLGFLLGVLVQGVLAKVHGLSSGHVLMLALTAGVLGLLGARAYYLLTHPRERKTAWLAGLSVQGFVIASTAVFVLGGWAMGLRVGHLLDASIPALLVGQAVGRLGCLLAGCCSGRPTTRHWAVWSSDRTVGTRRIPVQLLESSSAAVLALATGLVAWLAPAPHAGFLFLAGLAAYVLVRQVLFPLRGLPRATRYGRTVMIVAAPAVLVGAVIASALA